MRTVIIMDGDQVQFDFIPENDHDAAALAMIKDGQAFRAGKASGYQPCRGGYHRPFGNSDAVKFTYIRTPIASGQDESQ